MAARNIGKLVPGRTALFLCDLQEKFRKTIQYFPEIVEVSNRMLRTAKALDMPVVVTEQYPKGNIYGEFFFASFISLVLIRSDILFPKTNRWLFVLASGLGSTVAELGIDQYPEIKPVDKVQFSMCTPEIIEMMKSKHPNVSYPFSYLFSRYHRSSMLKSVNDSNALQWTGFLSKFLALSGFVNSAFVRPQAPFPGRFCYPVRHRDPRLRTKHCFESSGTRLQSPHRSRWLLFAYSCRQVGIICRKSHFPSLEHFLKEDIYIHA